MSARYFTVGVALLGMLYAAAPTQASVSVIELNDNTYKSAVRLLTFLAFASVSKFRTSLVSFYWMRPYTF
jgi:hypothetical protein